MVNVALNTASELIFISTGLTPRNFATLGLLLVPNGETIGFALGDYYPSREPDVNATATNSTESVLPDAYYPHPWSVFFTILGTVLLDFDADACQSPSRAYLLDVTLPGKL